MRTYTRFLQLKAAKYKNTVVYGTTACGGVVVRFIILIKPLYNKTPETRKVFFMILKLLRRMTGRPITDFYDLYKKWKSGWGLNFLIVDYKGEFVSDLKLILLLLFRFTPISAWGIPRMDARNWARFRQTGFPLIHELLLLDTTQNRFFQVRQLYTKYTLNLFETGRQKIKNDLLAPTTTLFDKWVVPTQLINYSFRFFKITMSIKTLEYKEETYYE